MTTLALHINEKTYGQLLRRTLPHVIHSTDEYERLTAALMELDERANPSPEEKELAELLTMLIEEFEARRYPIRKASPVQVLRHLMEARNLTQKGPLGDFWIERNCVRGKRSISKTQAKKLASFFNVTADLFI